MSSITKSQARSSIKSLSHELSNLTPSALIELYEIDLSTLLDAKSLPNLSAQAQQVGFAGEAGSVLRFHNNVKVFNSTVIWNKKTYYPAPIEATGFENSSRGTLPTPLLTIASQSDEGTKIISLLRHQILKNGDIIGAKVTRRRTFAKYLDWENFEFASSPTPTGKRPFSPRIQELPDGYEPDPNAELPKDVYFIERKTAENKRTIAYQLSSILDLEGVKIPRRVIIADKCNFSYRGPGCWYQHIERGVENQGVKYVNGEYVGGQQNVPVLQKAELNTTDMKLPNLAPPVATDKDELIGNITGKPTPYYTGDLNMSEWREDSIRKDKQGNPIVTPDGKALSYQKNDFVYLIKNKIKYYFVAKVDITKDINKKNPPPHGEHWVADNCSKTLNGCRLRWGVNGAVAIGDSGCQIGKEIDGGKGGLPFGGFPAARKVGGGR